MTAEEIKEKVSCREFVEKIGLKINRSGFCCCPFHGEKTPSLKIYDSTNSWYCFGCHAGGDVISFAKMYYKVSFSDAVKRLANDFNLSTNENDVLTASDALKRAVERATCKSLLERKERLKTALEAKYWLWFDRWLENDRAIAEYAPKSPDDEFDSRWVKAIMEREQIRNELAIADDARREGICGC